RLFFDDTKGYVPLRLEYDYYRTNELTGKSGYAPDLIVEWGDPVTLANGFTFARTALFRRFDVYPTVTEGLPREQWPRETYETYHVTYRFSNIQVNEALAPALFAITPPKGTNVLDEIARVSYI